MTESYSVQEMLCCIRDARCTGIWDTVQSMYGVFREEHGESPVVDDYLWSSNLVTHFVLPYDYLWTLLCASVWSLSVGPAGRRAGPSELILVGQVLLQVGASVSKEDKS